jgi:hypothetical protein
MQETKFYAHVKQAKLQFRINACFSVEKTKDLGPVVAGIPRI